MIRKEYAKVDTESVIEVVMINKQNKKTRRIKNDPSIL